MYSYTWYQWLAFFYFYCFFGWIFESTYVSIKTRRFVNRGFLRIPMLPLYGTGAIMMLWVSLPVKDNLLLVYLSGMIGATALEYVTGYLMERLFKVRYWDYSNQKFQLNSYICLSSSIAWGFLTILMTEVIHRPVADLILRFHPLALVASVSVITTFFLADVYESTRTAFALGKTLEAMTKLRQEMDEIQEKLSAAKKETVQFMAEIREETAQKLAEKKEETENLLSDIKEETALLLSELKEEQTQRMLEKREAAEQKITEFREETLQKIREKSAEREELAQLRQRFQALSERRSSLFQAGYYRRSLLKGNPGATSGKFAGALKELKEFLQNPDKGDRSRENQGPTEKD